MEAVVSTLVPRIGYELPFIDVVAVRVFHRELTHWPMFLGCIGTWAATPAKRNRPAHLLTACRHCILCFEAVMMVW